MEISLYRSQFPAKSRDWHRSFVHLYVHNALVLPSRSDHREIEAVNGQDLLEVALGKILVFAGSPMSETIGLVETRDAVAQEVHSRFGIVQHGLAVIGAVVILVACD